MQQAVDINRKLKIAYVADNLPPIIKTSSNRNLAFAIEISKHYELHVFTLTESEKLKKVVGSSTSNNMSIHTVPQKQRGWKNISFIKYLLRFSQWDILNAAYINEIKVARQQEKFDLLIISAGPFNRLRVGYAIHDRFTCPWCIDYRDEWNSKGSLRTKVEPTLITRFLDLFLPSERSMEMKFTSTIAAFSSVHHQSVEHISQLINKEGFVIENGYFKSTFIQNNYPLPSNESIRIAYWGNVYDSQNMREHIATLVSFVHLHKQAVSIDFYGCSERVFQVLLKESLTSEFLKLNLLKPLSTEQLFTEVTTYDALIHSEYADNPHIPSSKLYDYVATGLPVILLNNFGGYISDVLQKTNQLLNFNSSSFLQFLTSKEFREQFRLKLNDDVRKRYSREEQMLKVHEMIQFALKDQNHQSV